MPCITNVGFVKVMLLNYAQVPLWFSGSSVTSCGLLDSHIPTRTVKGNIKYI